MLEKFFIGSFSKAMIFAVISLVGINAYLCNKGKRLEADLHSKASEIALVKADNQKLSNQLENAQLAILQYQSQVKALHQNVLNQLKQSEQRTHALLNTLEQHQKWANQPVPAELSRLFAKRSKNPPASTALPAGKSLPLTKP